MRYVGDDDVHHLDTASGYHTVTSTLMRTFTRQLFACPARDDPVDGITPVADLATEVPTKENGGVSDDGTTLAFVQQAIYVHLTRGSMPEVLGEDYIRTARAKGVTERRVVNQHGLRAGMTPVLSQFGVDIGQLMGGVLVTETVFGLQGMGQAAVNAVDNGDLPVIMGVVIVISFFVVLANLAVDALCGFVDPRVRVT